MIRIMAECESDKPATIGIDIAPTPNTCLSESYTTLYAYFMGSILLWA